MKNDMQRVKRRENGARPVLSSGAVPEAKRRRLKVEVTDRDHAEARKR